MTKDLAISVGGEALVFRPLQEGAYIDDSRVVCPKCTKTVARKKARQHCRSCKFQTTGAGAEEDGGGVGDRQASVDSGRKWSYSDLEDSAIVWEKMCRSVPSNILQSVMDNLNAAPFHINGCAMILSVEAQELLRSILPEEYCISKIGTSQEKAKDDITNVEDRLKDTHEPVTSGHLSVIEAGGEDGLERLMGAVIVSGENNFRIMCAEI
ncbi:MAG: hypothetical protein BYD32DRAFT_152630 [Podila humilis]|nr:MAG: hypothetical protein BYD32DRAFT_152630 [Podila humilis]